MSDLYRGELAPLICTAARAGENELREAFPALLPNTAPFNVTHHPAMNVSCGMVDELPVGMMLVARHFDEMTIYRAAYAFEQAVDWTAAAQPT